MFPEMGRWSARKRDNRGRTPLYYALRYNAPPGVQELLLGCMRREDILEGGGEGSILGLVWDSWAISSEGKKILGSIGKKLEEFDSLGKIDSEASWRKRVMYAKALREKLKGNIKDNWDKANLLLRGAFRFPLEKEEEEDEGDEDYDFCTEQENAETSRHPRKWRVLHATTTIRCHSTLFKMACAIHPEQAREIDKNDLFYRPNGANDSRTALHFASENSSKDPRDARETRRMLQVLLSLYPEAASIPNPTDGRLPLHYLCKNDSKVHWYHDGLGDVHDAYPRAALVEDTMGRTPLHHAASIIALRQTSHSGGAVAQSIALHDPESIVYNLVFTHPSTATIADKDGKLPLHIIAMVAETWDASIQTLYDMFPVALRRRTTLKTKARCPIHLMSSNPDARSSLVEAIVEKHPMGAGLVDGKGMLPLHVMCESGKTWDGGMEYVYNAYSKAISIAEDTRRGWFPLHFIVTSSGVSMGLIRKILDLYPQAAKEVDGNGKTPLHLIVESGKNWECVEAIFLANPGAIIIEDLQGQVPLIAAALSMCDSVGNRSNGGSDERADDVLMTKSLPQAPTTSSCDGNSTRENIQGSASTMMTSTTHGIEEMLSRPPQSCRGERSDSRSRDASLSQLNVLYRLLRAAPHVLN